MDIELSIISHDQGPLALELLQDLTAQGITRGIRLTINRPDTQTAWPEWPGLQRHTNPHPLGFAANHNRAFADSQARFFCVLNPDLRLSNDPFPALLDCMQDPQVGLVAPLVRHPLGALEDSARHFPTLSGLLRKAMGLGDGRYHLQPNHLAGPQPVQWVAGMFLLIRADAFRAVGGFDDKFHLYYEDVDLCARLWRAGWKVMLCPQACVVHAAQRASRHKPRYAAWHAASMTRYFAKHWGRLPQVPDLQPHPIPSQTRPF